MRRILQDSGAEVVHIGHNRSAGEIVNAAIQEDAQGIAVSSYQGGHIEFFKSIPSPLNNTFEFVNSPKSGYLLRDGLNRNPFWDLRKQF